MSEVITAPTPKEKKQPKFNFHKIFAAIGLILIVAIIILFGTAIIFHVDLFSLFNSSQNEDNTPLSTTSAKPKVASSSAEIKTSDWKTYTNQTAAFTIKYPSAWLYTDYSTNNNCSQDQVFFSPTKDELGICASSFGGLISVSRTQPADDLNRMVAGYNPNDYTDFKKTDTFLAGKQAVKITGTSQINNEAADQRGTKVIVYIVALSTRSLVLSYNQNKSWSDDSATFEAMVKTLTLN